MVCLTDDEYVRDRMRWVVILNNGQTVYEDDDRPGESEPSAWKRLKTYCGENQFFITEMWLQFRSNRVLIEPRNASGYYLIKSVVGIWGEPETQNFYIVGVLDGEIVNAEKWKIPELIGQDKHVRVADFESPSLIFNPG